MEGNLSSQINDYVDYCDCSTCSDLRCVAGRYRSACEPVRSEARDRACFEPHRFQVESDNFLSINRAEYQFSTRLPGRVGMFDSDVSLVVVSLLVVLLCESRSCVPP